MILSRNVLNYLKEGKTLEEACAKAGVVSNELNIWKLWADKGLQPYPQPSKPDRRVHHHRKYPDNNIHSVLMNPSN